MKYWKFVEGRQRGCSYKKMCLWSIRILSLGFDAYLLKYQPNTKLPWHTDKLEGKHYRLNIKLFGRAYFLIKGICRKRSHDRIILFRPDLHEHSLIVITKTVKLSFGFAKLK